MFSGFFRRPALSHLHLLSSFSFQSQYALHTLHNLKPAFSMMFFFLSFLLMNSGILSNIHLLYSSANFNSWMLTVFIFFSCFCLITLQDLSIFVVPCLSFISFHVYTVIQFSFCFPLSDVLCFCKLLISIFRTSVALLLLSTLFIIFIF